MDTWGLPDALQILHQQYPGAYVTSGARDPNSPLGRANPSSYHNTGQAFDIRPMPGVTFDSYVSSLRNAGLPVVHALDEAKHPAFDTTGPNWHIAFATAAPKGKQMATSPIDMIRRAQAFNVDIPQQGGPMGAAPAPAAAPAAPGGLDIQSILSQLAAMQQAPEQQKKIPTWVKLLGSLGDAYGQVNGRDPTFLPTMLKQQQLTQDRNDSRLKLNEQIASDRASILAKLMDQPAMLQDFNAFQGMDPQQQHQFLQYKDAVNPNTVATPQGTTNVPRTSTKVINGKTYYNIGDQWFEEGQ